MLPDSADEFKPIVPRSFAAFPQTGSGEVRNCVACAVLGLANASDSNDVTDRRAFGCFKTTIAYTGENIVGIIVVLDWKFPPVRGSRTVVPTRSLYY